MNYFLTDGHSIRGLGTFPDHERAIAAWEMLKNFDVTGFDLCFIDPSDLSASVYEPVSNGWNITEYTTILESIGLPAPGASDDMVREHPAFVAAIEHIEDLENKFDDARRELEHAQRAIEQVDVDYREFDADEYFNK